MEVQSVGRKKIRRFDERKTKRECTDSKKKKKKRAYFSLRVSVSVCASLLLSVVSRFVSDVLYE